MTRTLGGRAVGSLRWGTSTPAGTVVAYAITLVNVASATTLTLEKLQMQFVSNVRKKILYPGSPSTCIREQARPLRVGLVTLTISRAYSVGVRNTRPLRVVVLSPVIALPTCESLRTTCTTTPDQYGRTIPADSARCAVWYCLPDAPAGNRSVISTDLPERTTARTLASRTTTRAQSVRFDPLPDSR